MEFKYMNTYKTSDLIRLYTCKSKLVSVATKTGLLRNRKPTLVEVLVYAVIKIKKFLVDKNFLSKWRRKKNNASSATVSFTFHTLPYMYLDSQLFRAAAASMQGDRFSFFFLYGSLTEMLIWTIKSLFLLTLIISND